MAKVSVEFLMASSKPSAQSVQVTVHQAAEALQVSPDTVRRWAKKGLIRSSRNALGHRLFNLAELHRTHLKFHGTSSPTRRPFQTLKAKSRSPFTSIELFSGCGGLALGLENAGFTSKLLVEWDRHACHTLRANWPEKRIVEGDVAKVDFSPFRDQVDVVAGGFPCQAFSYAGHSRGFEDTRGTLFFEFARCVDQVRPKIALGENVRGLLRHDGGRTLDTMIQALDQLGYRAAVKVLRSQFHDVAQKRERLFILAIRKDLDLPFLFPAERDYMPTLRDVLHQVPESPGVSYTPRKHAVMELVPEGGYWRDLPEPVQREFMGKSYFLGGGRTGMARRMAWDEPALTLTCSPAQKQTERCHPSETRPFTTREYARIQSFPDSWLFKGNTASIYRQIGNAVPVNLAYHMASALRHMLEGNHASHLFTPALLAPTAQQPLI